jgi:hypothetical protein
VIERAPRVIPSTAGPSTGCGCKAELLATKAAELVRVRVEVIVAFFAPTALATKQETSEIPIVMAGRDPVETGIVASLARPERCCCSTASQRNPSSDASTCGDLALFSRVRTGDAALPFAALINAK